MGTWNTSIEGNDTFQDIYQEYYNLYNEGHHPINISTKLKEEYGVLSEDNDERNNHLFGLALAQWETKVLDPLIYDLVKNIILNGDDLLDWGSPNVGQYEERKVVLNDFLTKLSTPRLKAKRRVRPKHVLAVRNLVHSLSPDSIKEFRVGEMFDNGIYLDTSAFLDWNLPEGGGGGNMVLQYKNNNAFIDARWIDNKNLEITHDKNIIFFRKLDKGNFFGDEINIIYKEVNFPETNVL